MHASSCAFFLLQVSGGAVTEFLLCVGWQRWLSFLLATQRNDAEVIACELRLQARVGTGCVNSVKGVLSLDACLAAFAFCSTDWMKIAFALLSRSSTSVKGKCLKGSNEVTGIGRCHFGHAARKGRRRPSTRQQESRGQTSGCVSAQVRSAASQDATSLLIHFGACFMFGALLSPGAAERSEVGARARAYDGGGRGGGAGRGARAESGGAGSCA
eukprot:6205890-Pleurochrysis_carterae.AAC.4